MDRLTHCLLILLGSLALVAGLSSATLAGNASVPADDLQQQIRSQIKQLYSREYSRRDTDGKVLLINLLIREAGQTRATPDRQYVYLDEARALAQDAGQVALAMHAAQQMADRFDVDELALEIETLEALRTAARQPNQIGPYVDAMMRALELAIDQDAYAKASPLVGLLKSTAPRTRDAVQKVAALQLVEDFDEIKKAYEAMVMLNTELATDGKPKLDDPKARAAWGRFVCLYKGDWVAGLSHLAEGGASPLQPAARRELGNPQTGRECLALADMWIAQSRQERGLAKRRLEEHAIDWQVKALPKLPPNEAQPLRERLVAAGRRVVGGNVLSSGLRIDIFNDTQLKDLNNGWPFPMLERNWGVQKPLALKSFSSRMTGFIDVPKTSTYLLQVKAEGELSVWINDRFVTRATTGPNNAVVVPADFHRGLNAVRLEFVDAGGTASFAVRWASGEGLPFTAVPFTSLFHVAR